MESITSGDRNLYESIISGYLTLFEARVLPDLIEVESDKDVLTPHTYQVKFDHPTHKQFIVCATDSINEPSDMIVNLIAMPTPNQYDDINSTIWQINFTPYSQSFNITNDGSIDLFNSVMSLIKILIDKYNIEYLTFNPTDRDQNKREQKQRIYAGYLTHFGFTAIPESEKKGRIIYTRN